MNTDDARAFVMLTFHDAFCKRMPHRMGDRFYIETLGRPITDQWASIRGAWNAAVEYVKRQEVPRFEPVEHAT